MFRTQKISIHKITAIALFYISGPLFLMLTNPQDLPLPIVLLPFIWLFIAIFMAVQWSVKLRAEKLDKRRRMILAGVSAALPVLLLVFESVHQLSIRDVLIVIALLASISFYMSRANFLK